MTYAVAQDLINRYGLDELNQLADRNGDGAYDQTVIDQVMADSDAEINAALGTRYELPLPTVPTLLVGLACDLARWRLWKDAAPQRVTDAAVAARKILVNLAGGAMSLGLPEAAPTVTSIRPRYRAPDPVFSGNEG